MADSNVNFTGGGTASDQGNQPSNNPELEYLKSIDQRLQELIRDVRSTSQSQARDSMPRRSDFRNRQASRTPFGFRGAVSSVQDEFFSGFSKGLRDAVLGSDFNDRIRDALDEMADMVGMDLKDIPSGIGQELGKQVTEAFKQTKLGKDISDRLNSLKDEALGGFKDRFSQGVNDYFKSKGYTPAQGRAAARSSQSAARTPSGTSVSGAVGGAVQDVVGSAVGNVADDVIAGLGSSVSGASATMSGLTAAASPLISSVLPGLIASGGALVVAWAAVKLATWAFTPAIESAKKALEGLSKSANRYNTSRQKNLEHEQERIRADLESIVKEPFDILQDAAQKVYDAWDANLRLINQTQGYTKEDLQSLMGAYATRLRADNLSSVVSAADMTQSLAKVLEAGLSGAAAEEFSYIATILNAAIPSQDFFQYADTYASLAANAMKAGKSQEEAISYANEQLELFASNVLYASRELSGGFTTGLQNAGNLFQSAVSIAQASRTGDPSEIAGILTSVAAVTGSIAPDLASSLTDMITQAATGGNSDQLVALRSLAGINASNTQFLQQLANDPQGIFEDLFRGLANMQNMSNDAYMEVAEGLSSIFGVSMDAFARVDFNYLADAIADMNVSNASLEENLKLLQSGESTTSAEQLRMQRINEYLIDEGLSYVMDNEVARAIQQHMWDEQIARELMEATYAVELTGSALQFLEGIRRTIDNITGLINPFAWVGKIASVVQTATEGVAQSKDLKQILELGKVGSGNATSFYQLTTTNKDLNVTPDLVTLLGGISHYGIVSGIGNWFQGLGHVGTGSDIFSSIGSEIVNSVLDSFKSVDMPDSKYAWGTVSKSLGSLAGAGAGRQTSVSPGLQFSNVSTSQVDEEAAQLGRINTKLQQYISDEYFKEMAAEGQTYEDWQSTVVRALKPYGVTDLSETLSDLGYSEEGIKAAIQSAQTTQAVEEQLARYQREEDFWDDMLEYTDEIEGLINTTNEFLNGIYKKEQEFYDAWVDYFVNHTAYNEAFTTRDQVVKIQNQEKEGTEDAIYALAEALQDNSIDLLRDPTLQTNALLAQILIVVNAIMQQNNTTSGGLSLPDTLAGLSMGLVESN